MVEQTVLGHPVFVSCVIFLFPFILIQRAAEKSTWNHCCVRPFYWNFVPSIVGLCDVLIANSGMQWFQLEIITVQSLMGYDNPSERIRTHKRFRSVQMWWTGKHFFSKCLFIIKWYFT